MKAHIAVDADSGLVHTVTTTAANKSDVAQIADLLHGKEQHVWADSGYRGAQSRAARKGLKWHIAARPSDVAKLAEGRAKQRLEKQEQMKSRMLIDVLLRSAALMSEARSGPQKVRQNGAEETTVSTP